MICALVESSFAYFAFPAFKSFEKKDLYRKARKGVSVHRGLSQPWLALQPWLAAPWKSGAFSAA